MGNTTAPTVETGSGFAPYRGGHYNWALYPPTNRVDAYAHSPVFPNSWAIVFWYPGKPTQMFVASSKEECITQLNIHYNKAP